MTNTPNLTTTRPIYMVVYLVQNILNGKIYIGKHKGNNPLVRWRAHCAFARSGGRYRLSNAIRKYGEGTFQISILAVTSSGKELNNLERLWIILLNSRDQNVGYNMTAGGDGWSGLCSESMEALKQRRREFGKGNKNALGKHWKSKKNSDRCSDSCWINNGQDDKFIRLSELSTVLAAGWKRGRIRATGPRNTTTHLWINHDGITKRTKPEELRTYLDAGWKRGRGIAVN